MPDHTRPRPAWALKCHLGESPGRRPERFRGVLGDMQGFGTDRTLSTQEWRALVLAGCGVLVVGVVVGVLIGRLTVSPPEPAPASASILPETVGLPDSDPMIVSASVPVAVPNTVGPAPTAPPPVVPAAVALPPAMPAPPAIQSAVTPPPERVLAAAPAVVASPRPAHPVRAKPVEPTPAAKPAPVEDAPPATGGRWVVQLGAFQSSDHANLLVNTLAAHGQAAHVTFVKNAEGQGWFYVQTPPYRSAAAAKTAAQALAAREHLPTYLIKLPADAG